MSLISQINSSKDLKKFNIKELQTLAEEIRSEIISVTEKNGGHLSSNLGIVEATIAIHYVFDLPNDKLIFDVGHQCYTHKILSGRKEEFKGIRTDGGISGFPDSSESEYDAFSTGHAGTSLSAGLGLCTARDKLNENYFVINVVGDGALVNGLNLEALFATETKPRNYIVILNDNGMSISKNKNGFYRFISKGTANKNYARSKRAIKRIFKNSFVTKGLVRFRDFVKRVFNKRSYLEQFGYKYVEASNGNDIKELVKILSRIKETPNGKAIFLHIQTKKGKGLKEAEERADVYHGIGKADGQEKSFSKAVGEKINSLIEKDNKVIAITAGMKDGTGLSIVEEKFPSNFLDVGIAEEYAVTLSAGMAKGGLKPIVAIYSTFMQRAYDEILHDVCLQNLPVVFLLDRAGLVGEDGKTHQGVFDLSYLSHIPNLTVLAPNSIVDMEKSLDYALSLSSPVAIRYPKKEAQGFNVEKIESDFSKWETVKEGKDITILAVGPEANSISVQVANNFNGKVKVVNARIVKPLDYNFLQVITSNTIITIEENSVIGGFGQMISAYFSSAQKKVINLGVKDEFIVHGARSNQLKYNGLDKETLSGLIEKSL